jgi:hypothetical protein
LIPDVVLVSTFARETDIKMNANSETPTLGRFTAMRDASDEHGDERAIWAPPERPRIRRGPLAFGAIAAAALALGFIAIAALAIGRLVVGSLSVGRGHARELRIGRLAIGDLRLGRISRR